VIAVDGARRMTWPETVVADPVEAIIRAYSKGENVRWIPLDRRQVNALCAGILRRGGVELLLDEITFWTLSGWAPQHLDALIRTHAPPLDVRIRMTTQDPMGFTRKLRTCVSDVYGFRLEDDAALSWVRMWFKERTPALKSLKKRKYFEWHVDGI